ncbi:MAG TPA: hypothetical protein VGE66_04885 [Chitinophagaceae bacterium]
MSTRSDALCWLKAHYGAVNGPVCTSKYYEAHESWTRTPVWFFQVPVRHIEGNQETYIHLVCRAPLNGNAYHYLRVPASYFREHFSKLGFTTPQIINLHLSAQTANMFDDERGKGKVSFSRFLMV